MLTIRKVSESEVDFVRKQRLKAYEEYSDILPKAHWEALRDALSSDADEQVGVDLLVAELDGDVVGSVALFPAKSDAYKGLTDLSDDPEIRMLAVKPESRGKGVAEALIRECISRANEKGSKYVGLHTGEFMMSAMKLYERLGFERVPELDFEPANDGIIVKGYRLKIEA